MKKIILLSIIFLLPVHCWADANGDALAAYGEKNFQVINKLAEQGNIKALYFLGKMYENGEGVAKNLMMAKISYSRAAVNGDADAQYRVGMMYKNGEGMVKNTTVAEGFFRFAAKQGHVDAQKQLGLSASSNVTKKNPTPTSLNNFYSIDPRGGVMLMKGSNERLTSYNEILSKYATDAGVIKGKKIGYSIYEPKEAILVVHDYIPKYLIADKLREYCNTLKVKVEMWKIKPYVLPDGSTSTNVWQLLPLTTDGVCQHALFSRKTCESAKCIKYKYEKRTITSSRKVALEISKNNMATAGALPGYKESAQELENLKIPTTENKKTPAYEREKGYYEYNGNCGLNSCNNEDNLRILEDYYYPR